MTKAIEPSLLLSQGGGRWARRLGFQDTMHPLVLPVLLWLARFNQFGSDAEPDPPDRERREPPQCGRGEGSPVVGANRPRQAILFKELEEGRFGPFSFG